MTPIDINNAIIEAESGKLPTFYRDKVRPMLGKASMLGDMVMNFSEEEYQKAKNINDKLKSDQPLSDEERKYAQDLTQGRLMNMAMAMSTATPMPTTNTATGVTGKMIKVGGERYSGAAAKEGLKKLNQKLLNRPEIENIIDKVLSGQFK